MKRELILAAVAALSLAACSPDLSSGSPENKDMSAAPAQPAEASRPVANEATVAQAAAPAAATTQSAESEKRESAAPATNDGKEDDKKDDGEKKPQ